MKQTSTRKLQSFAAVASLVLGLAVFQVQAEGSTTSTNTAASDKIGNPPVVTVKALLEDPKPHAGKRIVLEGFVTDYCKRKGCWANLHDSDPDAKGNIRVKQDESSGKFKPFLADLQGKTILVTGKVHETRIDKEYLDKWEARVKAAQEKAGKAKGKTTAEESSQAVFKQITAFRERVAKSDNGYLTSISLSVEKWETKPAKI